MFSLWGGSSELQKKADATLHQLNAVRADLVRSEAGRQRLRVALADQAAEGQERELELRAMELELRAMAARDSSRQQLAPVREEALDDQEVTEVKVAEAEAAVVRMKAEHASMAASMAAAQERAVALAKEVAELQAERDALRSESGSGRRAVGEVEGGGEGEATEAASTSTEAAAQGDRTLVQAQALAALEALDALEAEALAAALARADAAEAEAEAARAEARAARAATAAARAAGCTTRVGEGRRPAIRSRGLRRGCPSSQACISELPLPGEGSRSLHPLHAGPRPRPRWAPATRRAS